MKIETNLTQLENLYLTINSARHQIQANSPSQQRVAGRFANQANHSLSKVLEEMAAQIKIERQKVITAVI